MKISSIPEFHSLVRTLRTTLFEASIPVKTSRAQELLAQSLGFKSANGLFAALPLDVNLTDQMCITFQDLLSARHNVKLDHAPGLLRYVEREHKSISTTWGSDKACYPKKLLPNENFWYLTDDGWIPWSNMDFNKMRVELNIYKLSLIHI